MVRDLVIHADSRGKLCELFRGDWGALPVPQQWNLVRTQPNTLRGVHIHAHHEDYLVVIDGLMRVGLFDLREGSPSRGRSALVEISGEQMQAVFVPKGVMHGFYFPMATTYVYGLTACWTPADDLGCRWYDPELDLPWGAVDPVISERDAEAPSLAELRRKIAAQGWVL